jgi:hypothetical protein
MWVRRQWRGKLVYRRAEADQRAIRNIACWTSILGKLPSTPVGEKHCQPIARSRMLVRFHHSLQIVLSFWPSEGSSNSRVLPDDIEQRLCGYLCNNQTRLRESLYFICKHLGTLTKSTWVNHKARVTRQVTPSLRAFGNTTWIPTTKLLQNME